MDAKKDLLIIDDEIEVLNTLKRVFYKDYKVHISQSPKEAIGIIGNFNIEVIICDQHIPEMKGAEFFTIVKELYPDTIRILITGYTELSDAIISINEGNIFRDFKKSWSLFELKSLVKEAFIKNDLIRENSIMLEALKKSNITLKNKVRERTEELEVKNEELKKISNEKSRILGIVAHDLRSPVGSIFSLSEYICTAVKEKTKKEPVKCAELNESLEFIEMITESSEYLLELINDIIDMSTIETGKLTLKLESIDYLPFINKIIRMNQELAKNKNITILSLLEIKDNLTICVDKIKISQVINNFIQNAIKFSYPFGKIILKVEVDDDYITTKVIDEGEGIPKSQRDKLFKVFSKTSIVPTGGERSNGLGLYISRNIIEAHDGIIAFEENLNKGSIFYFKLRKDLN